MTDLHRLIKETKKADLVKFANQKCKHNHSYLSHPNCMRDELNKPERIGILDIESAGVRDMTYEKIHAYAIKVYHQDKYYTARETSKTIKNKTYDLELVKQFSKDIMNFDKILTYCGTWHDFPALRTRMLYWQSKGHDVSFPLFGEIKHHDLYFTCDSKLKLRNKRLWTVSQLLNIPSKGIFTTPEMSWAANAGCDKALTTIMNHAVEDTLTTERVFDKLYGFVNTKNVSI